MTVSGKKFLFHAIFNLSVSPVIGSNMKIQIQKLFKVKNLKFVDINKPHSQSVVPETAVDMLMLMYFVPRRLYVS